MMKKKVMATKKPKKMVKVSMKAKMPVGVAKKMVKTKKKCK